MTFFSLADCSSGPSSVVVLLLELRACGSRDGIEILVTKGEKAIKFSHSVLADLSPNQQPPNPSPATSATRQSAPVQPPKLQALNPSSLNKVFLGKLEARPFALQLLPPLRPSELSNRPPDRLSGFPRRCLLTTLP